MNIPNGIFPAITVFAGATVLACVLISAKVSGQESLRTAEYDYEAPAPGTYELPIIKTAGDGEVLDSEGRAFHLREITHGRITVLSFIYTRCADGKACPYATGVLNQLHRQSEKDAVLARGLRLVSMSFDPEIDTPNRMKSYSSWAATRVKGCEWAFVTTRSQSELKPILEQYGQIVDRKRNPLEPTGPLNHNLRVYLIDGEGNVRNIYSSGTLDVRLVLADVRTLLEKQERN